MPPGNIPRHRLPGRGDSVPRIRWHGLGNRRERIGWNVKDENDIGRHGHLLYEREHLDPSVASTRRTALGRSRRMMARIVAESDAKRTRGGYRPRSSRSLSIGSRAFCQRSRSIWILEKL